MEYHETGKLLGTVVLGEPHTFVGFTSRNPILFSPRRAHRYVFEVLAKGKEKVITVK